MKDAPDDDSPDLNVVESVSDGQEASAGDSRLTDVVYNVGGSEKKPEKDFTLFGFLKFQD